VTAETKNPGNQRGLIQNCDATLSIEARKILRYESHCFSDCAELVWTPTQDFLSELAEKQPKYILCCKSKPFSPNHNEEECVHVDIIAPGFRTPDFQSAYLGMVVNTKQAVAIWTKYAKNFLEKATICTDALPEPKARKLYDGYAERLMKLLLSGPLAIIRENIGCYIPVETERLSRRTVERGIRKMLETLLPSLAKLPIRWAQKDEQEAFERFVETEAKRQAKSQTEEERQEAFRSDVE